jgi:hypothetical protein
MMLRLATLPALALTACSYYVDLPAASDDGAPPDAGPPTDAPAWTWDTSSCSAAAVCPPAGTGEVSICGRVLDVGDDLATLGDQPAIWCDPAAPPAAGACSIRIQYYPALPFVGNPTDGLALEPSQAGIDGCGRFYAVLPVPELDFLAAVVDDADGLADARVPTWAAMAAPSGSSITTDLYTQTRALDAQWSASAGIASFADVGAVLILFRGPDALPAPDVQITEAGEVQPANDYYFSDADAHTRQAVAPALDATGADGAALKINSMLIDHSGTGGEPAGCTWDSRLARSVMGHLYAAAFGCM